MTTAAAKAPPALLPGEQRHVLAAAVAGGFAVVFCWAGLTPLYPDIAAALGVRADLLGAMVGLGAAISIACQLPVGVLIDRLGSRPFLTAGLGLMAAATVIRGVSPTSASFALAQALMGLAIPFYAGGSITAVAAAYSAARRGGPLGYIQSGTSLGQVVAFLVVGALAPLATWRQVSVGMALLPLAVVWLALTVPDPIPRRRRSLIAGTVESLRFLRRPGPAAIALVAAGALTAGSAALYVLPFALRGESLDARAASLLLLPYLLGAVVGAPLAGRAADRFGYRLTLAVLLPLGAAAAWTVALSGPRPELVVPTYLALGVAAMSIPALAAGLAARWAEVGGVATGAALGGVRLAQSTGPALGPTVGGLVYVHAGMSATLAVTGLAFAAATLIGLGIRSATS